jgi:hypothetical protein
VLFSLYSMAGNSLKLRFMKTAGLVNKLFTFGAVKRIANFSPLLAALVVAAPSVESANMPITPGTNDGDFSFVVSGTDNAGQLTKHIFKGNIKRFVKGVAYGLNDPKGTATFIWLYSRICG